VRLEATQAEVAHTEILTRLMRMECEVGHAPRDVLWYYRDLELSSKSILAHLRQDRRAETASVRERVRLSEERAGFEQAMRGSPLFNPLDLALVRLEAAAARAEMGRLEGRRDEEFLAQAEFVDQSSIVQRVSQEYFGPRRMSVDYWTDCEMLVVPARIGQAKLRYDRIGEMVPLEEHARALRGAYDQESAGLLQGRAILSDVLKIDHLLSMEEARLAHARFGHSTLLGGGEKAPFTRPPSSR